LAREGRDHPGFEIRFGLPHEPLEGCVGFAVPLHPVGERFRGHPGQLRGRLSIAAAPKGVEDDGGPMIREPGLPAASAALARELHDGQVLPSDPWELLRRLGWPADPSVMLARN